MSQCAEWASIGLLSLLGACGSDDAAPESPGSGGSGGTAGVAGGSGGSAGASGRAAGSSAGTGGSAPSCKSGRYVDAIFSNVKQTSDISYGQATTFDGKSQTLLLDLFQPEGDTETKRAAIVWIHGGGFIAGSRTDPHIVDLATRYAKKGYVTASIDYRLVSAAKMASDAAVAIIDAEHDARAAIRWMRAHAADNGVDSERIVVGGGSAGAITSLFVAYDESEGDSGNPGYSSEVSSVVDLWGSMYTQVGVLEAGEAPLIIVHGTADNIVAYKGALDLEAQAKKAGVPHELHPIEGAGHGPWDQIESFTGWITPFLCQHAIQ